MKTRTLWISLAGWMGLLALGCGPSAPQTSLSAAVKDGNYPAVRKHIAARSDLNLRDKEGWTPLHQAVMKGDLAMVKLLVEAGADVQRAGPQGKTILALAQEKSQAPIVEYLKASLEPKAAPDAKQPRGRALMDGGVGVSEVLDGF